MLHINRILVIDYLRVIAVLLVLLFHFFPKYFPYGYIGVDIFLVISGFVISKSIDNLSGNQTWFIFFKKRFFRLFPNLFFICCTSYFVFFFLYPENLQSILIGGILSSLSIISNFYYGTVSGYFDIISEINPFLHSWSLSLEWQFYLIITFLIFFFSNKIKIKYTVLIFTLISIILMLHYSSHRPIFNFYSFPTRFFEFGLGFLAFQFKTNIKYNIRYLLIFFFFSIFLFDGFNSSNWPNLYSLLLSIIVSLIILNDINLKIPNQTFKKIILWISDRSYSIYLVHFPFAAYYNYINVEPINSWHILLVFLIIFIISDLTYKFIENKLRFNYNKKYGNYSLLVLPVFLFLFFLNSDTIKYEDKFGNYVKNKFDYLKVNDSIDADIFIVGDSYAQDFVNILSDGFQINNNRMSATYIDMNCGNLFVNSKKYLKNIPNELKEKCTSFFIYDKLLDSISSSDVLVLSSNWPSWTLDYIDESIKNIQKKFKGTIVLVGTKHIGKQTPFYIENLSTEIRVNLRSSPPKYVNNINNKLSKISKINSNVIFFDIQKLLLDEEFRGIVCDSNGDIVSYDGGHLTKSGVDFLSKRIPIEIKKIFNDKK